MATTNVFLSDMTTNPRAISLGATGNTIGLSLGSLWVFVLAYFSFESLGWRHFILVTSIPLFVPPLVVIHCILPRCGVDRSSGTVTEVIDVPDWKIRLAKLSILGLLSCIQGHASILLYPEFVQEYNLLSEEDPCRAVMRGSQYLLAGGVMGLANVMGRVVGRAMLKRLSFRSYFFLTSLLTALFYGLLLVPGTGLVVRTLLTAATKFLFALQLFDIMQMGFDPK